MASDEDEIGGTPQPDERDPQFWRDLAEETRGMARKLSDPESGRAMLGVADEYEGLATLAQAGIYLNRFRLGL